MIGSDPQFLHDAATLFLLILLAAQLVPLRLETLFVIRDKVNVNVSPPPHQDLRVVPSSTSSWWERHVDNVARSHVPWKGNKTWCVPRDTTRLSGLYFVKIHKCASSTGAGINLRIAHNVASRLKFFNSNNNNTPVQERHTRRRGILITKPNEEAGSSSAAARCNSFQSHGGAFRNRREPFLLWTMLRHPAKRALSHFFHVQVSRKGVEPTDTNIIEYLERSKNFATRTLQESRMHSEAELTATIIHTFHFIAIVERMEESLVVMKLMFGLNDGDIINVMPAKQSGSFDSFGDKCTRIPTSFVTPAVQDYVRTHFPVDNNDFLLYAAANRSLDLTIHALGRRKVKEEVRRHRRLVQLVQTKCELEAVFPCSANGTLQTEKSQHSCYYRDWGCGYKCVDRFLRTYYDSPKTHPRKAS